MADIKQITPLARIWPTNKDRKNHSSQEQKQEKKEQSSEDNRKNKDQSGDTPHVDEYA